MSLPTDTHRLIAKAGGFATADEAWGLTHEPMLLTADDLARLEGVPLPVKAAGQIEAITIRGRDDTEVTWRGAGNAAARIRWVGLSRGWPDGLFASWRARNAA